MECGVWSVSVCVGRHMDWSACVREGVCVVSSVCGVECGVWRGGKRMWSEGSGAECGVQSVECEGRVWSVECAVWSVSVRVGRNMCMCA